MRKNFTQNVAAISIFMVALVLASGSEVWAANWAEATGGPLKVCVDLDSIKKQSNGFTYYHEVFCQEKASDSGYYNAVNCATAKAGSGTIKIIGRSPAPDAKGKYDWTDNSAAAASLEGVVARFVCSR